MCIRDSFCSDHTIRYPNGKDTISTNVLIVYSIILALLVFFLGEYLFDFQTCPTIKSLKQLTTKNIKCSANWLSPKRWYIRILKFFFMFTWSVLASQVLVNVLKVSIGSLRPNFFTACNPSVTCNNDGTDSSIYHTEYVCQAEGITAKKEASLRTSFPSGHAAFSAAAAFFLIVYIQKKMRRSFNMNCCGASSTINAFVVLLRPSLQFFCLLLACWVSLLRVSDYKHHLIDVIVGFILGGIIGIMTCLLYTSPSPRDATLSRMPSSA